MFGKNRHDRALEAADVRLDIHKKALDAQRGLIEDLEQRLDRHRDGLTQHQERLTALEDRISPPSVVTHPPIPDTYSTQGLNDVTLRTFNGTVVGRIGWTDITAPVSAGQGFKHALSQAEGNDVICSCGWAGRHVRVWAHLRGMAERGGTLDVQILP